MKNTDFPITAVQCKSIQLKTSAYHTDSVVSRL